MNCSISNGSVGVQKLRFWTPSFLQYLTDKQGKYHGGKGELKGRMKRQIDLLLFLLLLTGAVWGVFANSLSNDFVNMDDPDLVLRNRYIRDLTWENVRAIFTPGTAGTYQPVRTLSYALDYQFWQLNPFGYHLTNVICHTLSAWLVLLLIRALNQPNALAGVTALLFALHPVQVEAVTWVAGRRDVLSGLFLLLAVLAYVRFRSPGPASGPARALWYALALAAGGLGLLSKASVVVLPALLLLYDGLFGVPPERGWRRRLAHLGRSLLFSVPFAAMTLGFLAVFLAASRASGVAKAAYHGGSRLTTLLTMTRVFAEYVWTLLAPTNLSLTYGIRIIASPGNSAFLTAVLTLAAVGLLALAARKRAPIITFGILWWGIALLPVANILPIAVVKADRYLYVPSIGIFLVLAWACSAGWHRLERLKAGPVKIAGQALYGLLIAALLLSYGWLAARRNQDWRNSESLWNATLDTHPDSPIALNNLGLIYADQGKYEQAINLYQYLLLRHPQQHAIERVYANLGDAYMGVEQFEEAVNAYQYALDANPQYIPAYLGLARVTTGLRDYAGAARIYELALEFEPDNERILLELGKLRFIEGEYEAAIDVFERVLAANPYAMSAYQGLGLCYANSGQIDRAYLTYRQALAREPESTLILNRLGTLYMEQDEPEKAMQQFEALLRVDPENVDVRNNLGMLYLRAGQPEAALRELMAAARQQPDDPYILSNLAMAYAAAGLPEQARDLAQEALQRNPSLFRTHLFLGDVCMQLKDRECASAAYEQALELQPNNPQAQERLDAVSSNNRLPLTP